MQRDFVTTRYEIRRGGSFRSLKIVLLADLHGQTDSSRNRTIVEACRDCAPDLILSAGDVVTAAKYAENLEAVGELFRELAGLAPVCAVNGNHETQLRPYWRTYRRYEESMEAAGVRLLNNRSEYLILKDQPCCVSGLELPDRLYSKFRRHVLRGDSLARRLGDCPKGGVFTILLTHNPLFADSYFEWGADLTVAGHNHGGMIRAGSQSLLSPYGYPLPKYGYGHFQKNGSHLIVSAGLGEHSIPFRIHNPMELVLIDVRGEDG